MPTPSFGIPHRKDRVVKEFGYLVSILSVILLAIPAWENASDKPILFLCLLAGMAASILGMILRLISHRRERQERAGR